jgi:hypothetical protein
VIKHILAIAACGILATQAIAATADVETSVKTFDQIAATPKKLKAYCALANKMDEIGDDEKKVEAASAEIDHYYEILGAAFDAAWTAGADAAEGSPKAAQLEKAVENLDAKCT